ncbi:hypothetical protein BST81_07440 [Leptolyngbya sp. 'hensonii']|uniref:hypothetical protein n=1 Tax=Leptolyngbya sp. 'hensonii' TaxID=1922337 RepID=UPI00094F802C|nr:hypothetical protein [Leptolyngbya sp. 'hensonii']OLP19045.1 hypothetical protein BST81_07440 [Leptolyngbya sp. 'hensonii']
MKQTALNVTAIAIFTLTIASLLGPPLGISPFLPAGIILALLGLATLDNLGLQGQSSNLLLDWLTRTVGGSDYEDRIVHHEAGHFLVAYLLEIPITGYTLNAWEALRQGQPGQGGVSFDPTPLELDDQAQQPEQNGAVAPRSERTLILERYGTVWMAGIAAEILMDGNAEGGGDDRRKFQLLCQALKDSATEAQQRERWAQLRARTLIEEHWAAYEALVEAMRARSSVQDCYGVICRHLVGERGIHRQGTEK